MSRHIDYFAKLDCAGDVLNSVSPMQKPEASICEAISLIKRIRPIILRSPNKYRIVHVTDNNGLASILAAHLLPIVSAEVYSTQKKDNMTDRVEELSWFHKRLPNPEDLDSYVILIATGNINYDHIIDLYMNSNIMNVIMVPNSSSIKCKSENNEFDKRFLGPVLSKYLYLRNEIDGTIYIDKDIPIFEYSMLISNVGFWRPIKNS